MNRRRRKPPAGWGTVELLPSRRYRAFYRHDGSRFAAPHTFETKAAAQAWLAQQQADRSRGTWRDPRAGDLTLSAYATDWLDARPDLAPRTIDLYRRTLDRRVLPPIETDRGRRIHLGAMRLGDLTPAVVRGWYAAVYASTTAAAHAKERSARGPSSRAIRVWAREAGFEVAATGRLSPAVLTAWAAAATSRGDQPLTPNVGAPSRSGRTAAAHAYRVLRAVLSTAVQDGLLTHNPCQIPNAGVVRHRERSTASPEEVHALSAAMPRSLAAAVIVAAWSGLRYGELFALARRHFDADAGTLTVERALVCVPGEPIRFGPPKTARSRRTVHLPEFVRDVLATHAEEHVAAAPDALLFANAGAPVTNARLSFLFRRARTLVGRPELTWHDLRHTGATLAYRAGASVPEVQARLGHSTMRAATIYAHMSDGADRALAARLDALYAESAPTATLRPPTADQEEAR